MKILHKNRFSAFWVALIFICGGYGIALAQDGGIAEYLTRLNAEMAKPAMQGQVSMDDLSQIEAALNMIDSWPQLVNQASRYQFTVEEYNTITMFKDQVRAAQAKLFPMLRQAVVHALQSEMPKYKTSIKGDNFERVWFTSLEFRDMDATREVLEKYGVLLKRLRFNQADFMLDHEDVSTLSRFQPPRDTDIVLWDESFGRYSLFN